MHESRRRRVKDRRQTMLTLFETVERSGKELRQTVCCVNTCVSLRTQTVNLQSLPTLKAGASRTLNTYRKRLTAASITIIWTVRGRNLRRVGVETRPGAKL